MDCSERGRTARPGRAVGFSECPTRHDEGAAASTRRLNRLLVSKFSGIFFVPYLTFRAHMLPCLYGFGSWILETDIWHFMLSLIFKFLVFIHHTFTPGDGRRCRDCLRQSMWQAGGDDGSRNVMPAHIRTMAGVANTPRTCLCHWSTFAML